MLAVQWYNEALKAEKAEKDDTQNAPEQIPSGKE